MCKILLIKAATERPIGKGGNFVSWPDMLGYMEDLPADDFGGITGNITFTIIGVLEV